MPSRTLPARLRRILREMRWSQADMAKAIDADPSTVSRWMTDGHETIKPVYAFRLEDLAGFCARWILLGEGPIHVAESFLDGMPDDLRAEMLRHMQAMVRIVSDAKERQT